MYLLILLSAELCILNFVLIADWRLLQHDQNIMPSVIDSYWCRFLIYDGNRYLCQVSSYSFRCEYYTCHLKYNVLVIWKGWFTMMSNMRQKTVEESRSKNSNDIRNITVHRNSALIILMWCDRWLDELLASTNTINKLQKKKNKMIYLPNYIR